MKLSPYGMDTCCICDALSTHASPAEDGTYLPYCATCMRMMKDEFPSIRVLIWGKRPASV